ncbi:universal stress protein [Pseudomonas sp. ABC1]|uniref:universal stress protein n=1 Tax=Pseudomonas sp. ABC1 TaxID=2748080 RepID=UPI0015C32474|nr:universal stress protein [Pseudomonas sp. ABC1]QLF92349.1 universal stress protein [Pseudomonas sp. ABC1]
MQAIRCILVVVDPTLPEALALKRAHLISSVSQSHLHLLLCDTRPEQAAYLDTLRESLEQEGHSVSTQQAWDGSVHQTIINAQQAEGCGLVVKQHVPDNILKRALLTPDDWKLLRYCPCPVLMVKTDRPWTGGNILAAVDVGNADNEHRTLHSSIVDHGYDIAALAGGQLHVISAHPSAMLAAADPAFQLKETIEARYRAACQQFQSEFDIEDDHLHIEEGPADALIPYTCNRLQAVVTVLGTVARTGFSGVLMGNTAEVVLDALESDVLVLKPDDIIEHLEELVAQR